MGHGLIRAARPEPRPQSPTPYQTPPALLSRRRLGLYYRRPCQGGDRRAERGDCQRLTGDKCRFKFEHGCGKGEGSVSRWTSTSHMLAVGAHVRRRCHSIFLQRSSSESGICVCCWRPACSLRRVQSAGEKDQQSPMRIRLLGVLGVNASSWLFEGAGLLRRRLDRLAQLSTLMLSLKRVQNRCTTCRRTQTAEVRFREPGFRWCPYPSALFSMILPGR